MLLLFFVTISSAECLSSNPLETFDSDCAETLFPLARSSDVTLSPGDRGSDPGGADGVHGGALAVGAVGEARHQDTGVKSSKNFNGLLIILEFDGSLPIQCRPFLFSAQLVYSVL